MSYRPPLRSARCLTCQRKKKGCDRAVPTCSQCKRIGIRCEGYTSSNVVWLEPRSAKKAMDTCSSAPPTTTTTTITTTTTSTSAVLDVILYEPLARTARHQHFSSAFWSRYLLASGQQQCGKTSSIFGGSWMNMANGLFDDEPAVRFIVRALGISVLACLEEDAALEKLGFQTYGHAVLHVSAALQHPTRVKSDAIFAATKLFQLYEMFFIHKSPPRPEAAKKSGAQPSGLGVHLNGQISLLKHRGPQSFTAGFSHEIFCDQFFSLSLTSLFHQLDLSIEISEWRETPWKVISKSPRDVLSEILFDTGAFLQELNTFRRSSSWSEHVCESLVAKCNKISQRMNIWFGPLQFNIEKFDYTKVSTLPQQLSAERDVAFLALTHQYWVLCMCLESSLHFLQISKQNEGAAWQNGRATTDDDVTIAGNNGRAEPKRPLSFSPTDGYHENNKQQECDKDVTSFLSELKVYAYRIAHSVHLFFEPSFGVAVHHFALFSVGFGLRLLNAIEESAAVSPERNILLNSVQRIMHGRWIGKAFNNASTNRSWTESFSLDSLPDGGTKKIKQASLLWWTKE